MPAAATCGFAGIAYGALLNFSLMATYGGELSLERFGVLSARAIPFDAAHAIGNIVLALIAGPAIVRMLSRFRRRFEWGRGGGAPDPEPPPPPGKLRPAFRGGGLALFVAAALLLGALAPSPASAAGVDSATSWLRSVQNGDGGYGSSPERDSGTEMTAWVMLGLEAAGINPHDVTKGKHTPITYLRGHVEELESPGDLARSILALLGAGADPRDFGGRNLVADLHKRRRDNGSYLGWPNSTAFAVIALRAADSAGGTDKSLDWLRKVQNDDGGWGNEPGQRSDAEATGSVLQALSPDSKAAKQGLRYLRDAQQGNGGYRVGGNGAINTQATAWAVQGILAAGGDPSSVKRGGSTPFDYIAANQGSNGHYRYSKSSDQTPIWVTGQVLVAVSREHFPIAAVPRKKKDKASQSSGSNSAGTGGASVGPSISPAFEGEPGPVSSAGGGMPKSLAEALEQQGAGGSGNGAKGATGGGDGSGGAKAPDSPAADAVIGSAEEPQASVESVTANSEDDSSSDSDSSVAGAIVIGLLAGCLLFGLGLLGRKGWMRWRYGL
jgi:hypothetical protein